MSPEPPDRSKPSSERPGGPGPRPSHGRRDRRGRGLRGVLAPRPVPIAQTRSDLFDAMVLAAVDHLGPRLGDKLANIEFAVEDVPGVDRAGRSASYDPGSDYDSDVLEDNDVPLSRLYRHGLGGISEPMVVIYRRPLESRAVHAEDLADLVHDVVVEQIARLLGSSPEEIDPLDG